MPEDPNKRTEQQSKINQLDGLIKLYIAAQLMSASKVNDLADPDEYLAAVREAQEATTSLIGQICRLGHEIAEEARDRWT